MRGQTAKGLRRATAQEILTQAAPIGNETMYWQDQRTGAIRRISTCFRSVYQQAKKNYLRSKRS